MIYLDKKKHIATISGGFVEIMSDITFACVKFMEVVQNDVKDRKEIEHMLDFIKETVLKALDNPEEFYEEEKDTWQPSTMC